MLGVPRSLIAKVLVLSQGRVIEIDVFLFPSDLDRIFIFLELCLSTFFFAAPTYPRKIINSVSNSTPQAPERILILKAEYAGLIETSQNL